MTTATAVPEHLLTGLNPEQREAVTTLDGPLLVVAGPGSGKTRVLTHRIAALLATGTHPWNVLAVTFTNKAAAEMRERVGALVGHETANRMWIATFHSACVRILRSHHEEAGLPRSFTIADSADSAKMVAEVLAQMGQFSEGRRTSPEAKKLIGDVARTISHAKNNALGAEDLGYSDNPVTRLAGQVMVEYNARLRQRGLVDFDDILLHVLHILRAHPDITAGYQRKFTRVLVDEFQDTNAVQLEITRLLAGHGNLCVVGDADQSIYAFRGANPTVLDTYTQLFPGAHVVRLGQNYRSTANIVEVAQALIAPNPAQHRATMRTTNAPGSPVRSVEVLTNWDEASWVLKQIQSTGGPLGQHAVLVRTNALTRTIENVLKDAALPYDLVGAIRFFDRAEVKDAIAYLRLVTNPADALAFERAVGTPRRGVGIATVERIIAEANTTGRTPLDVASTMAASGGRTGKPLAAFIDLMDEIAAAALEGPVPALRVVLENAGLRKHYQDRDAKDDKAGDDSRVANLDELLDGAHDFVSGRAGTDPQGRVISDLDGTEQVAAFLEYASLMSSAEQVAGQSDATSKVQVATMHAAKGKEWDHVYVIGVEDGICPHARALNSGLEADLQEERRLMYVAASRARKTLALTHAVTRRQFNQDVTNAPSQFLLDLPDTVKIETHSPTGPSPAVGRPAPARQVTSTPWWAKPSTTPIARPPVRPAARPVRFDHAAAFVGANVVHDTFGPGVVASLDERTVTVRFADAVKLLVSAAAPMELVAP